MKTFYRLVDDVHVPKRWHLGELRSRSGVEVDFMDCAAWTAGPVTGEIDVAGQPLQFTLTSFGAPVVSRVLGDAIAHVAGADVQRVPLMLPGRSGFEALNALRAIRCIDEKRSSFRKWTDADGRPELVGGYRAVYELRVAADAVPEAARAFRVQGWPVGLIVCEEVKAAMEAAGCRGAQFLNVM